MRLQRKWKLITQHKMHTIKEQTSICYDKLINCYVFNCFYVYKSSCAYPRKNARICAAHQNSQDTVNQLNYKKKHGRLTNM